MRKMRDIMSPAPVRMRRIPVLRDGTPVGVVSIGDLALEIGVVSIGDLALEKGATSALSGISSAPPNS